MPQSAPKRPAHRPKKDPDKKALRVALYVVPRVVELFDALAAEDARPLDAEPSRGETFTRLVLAERARRERKRSAARKRAQSAR